MFERPTQHYIPAMLLLWRAASVTMHTSARLAAQSRTRSNAVTRRAPLSGTTKEAIPLCDPSPHTLLPSPAGRCYRRGLSIREAATATRPFQYPHRSLSYWTALRARLLPAALRLGLPVTATCLALAAGSATQGLPRAPNPLGPHGPQLPLQPTSISQMAQVPDAVSPSADVRSTREMLEARGYFHPGLQPGASWGGVASNVGSSQNEMHVMFEYLLLFPA